MKHYDFLVFIGRFQPFHKGHQFVVERALEASERLIILMGSAHQPRSLRNPWTIKEREQMIRSSLTAAQNERIDIAPLMDVMYNDEIWIRNVQTTVNGIVTQRHSKLHEAPRIGLVGHSKDHSSYYLSLFPQWKSLSVDNLDGISATTLREGYLANEHHLNDCSLLTQGSAAFLEYFQTTSDYHQLVEEYQFIRQYKSQWASAPYAPTFMTVDGVVVQSGHILLVKRRALPGKGLWALPGGFLSPDETLLESCIRELREETRIKVPAAVLKGNVKDQRTFDAPYRSSRGRTLTTAFLIQLPQMTELPKVKGGDDAAKATWVPLADINPEELFEDHYYIIQSLLGM